MKSFAVASFATLAAAVCHHGTTLSPRSSGLAKRSGGTFGYHGLNGPLNWHGLDPLSELCAVGTNQSPINLDGQQTDVSGSSFGLSIDSYPNGAEFENLGTTVQVYAEGSATIGTVSYELRQFHFHTPSEHHLNGEFFPAEVHFVFQAADESLAVIGFFLEIATGSETVSPVLTAALQNVGSIPSPSNITDTAALDFSSLIGHLEDSTVSQYPGSLTTPLCLEGVTFNVVEDPLYISVATFRALKTVVKFNSRYTQNSPGSVNLLDNARNILDL